jgi:hypothetical protein
LKQLRKASLDGRFLLDLDPRRLPSFLRSSWYSYSRADSYRTRVTQKSDVNGKSFFRLFMFLFGWMMKKSNCKALEEELNSLKKFCEQQTDSGTK